MWESVEGALRKGEAWGEIRMMPDMKIKMVDVVLGSKSESLKSASIL